MQQEWVNRDFLASSHVGTPDPRQASPPEGQRLLVSWKFPKNLLDQELTLVATIRYWDQSEEILTHPVNKRWGHVAFRCFKERLLTYRVAVIDRCGEVVDVWEHHFWTKLIDIDRKSDAVSSQPKQGSVMETP